MDIPFPMAVGEFAAGDTNIFWDVEDSSIFDGLDTYSISQNIKSVLENKGYHGDNVSIVAYVDENTLPKEFTSKFGRAGIQISFLPKGDTYSKVRSMLMDILLCALNHVNNNIPPSTLVVLSKNIEEDTLFSTIHDKAFKNKELFNVVLATLESLVGRGIPIGQKMKQLPNQIVIVISGTSGVDKEAVINKLREVRKGLHFAVTTTTSCQMMTSGEDYFLVAEDEFLRMVEKDELLKYSKDKGISKKEEIHDFMVKGEDIVLRMDDIDEALNLRDILGRSAVFIFLVAESDLSMEREAVKSDEVLVSLARKEFKHLGFDYVVVNAEGRLDDAVNRLKSIINAEKSKVRQRIVRI